MNGKPQFQKIYPLSPMQEGMLFHTLLDNNSGVYVEQLVFSVSGEIDPELFEKSLALLIKRHDMLRTNFIHQNIQKPRQVVFKEKKPALSLLDITDYTEAQQETVIHDFIENDRKRGFDLVNDNLMRITLIKTGALSYRLLWTFHHIIADGWCGGILTTDFFKIYQSLRENRTPVLEPCNQYGEYIKWLERQDREAARAYWDKYLADYEQSIVIPKLRKAFSAYEYRQEKQFFECDATTTEELKKLAANHQVTLSVVFQAIWGILLQKYNNVDDAVFGLVVSGRPPHIPGIEKTVGLFINTIPVRVKSRPGQPFSELIKEMQQAGLMAEKYSYFPLADIQSNSILKQNLIQHIVAFENYPVASAIENINVKELLGFEIDRNVEYFGRTNYDFEVVISPGITLGVYLNYNSLVYDRRIIANIEKHFKNIVKLIIQNPNIQSTAVTIITEAEIEEILYKFNDTRAEYPKDKTIQQLFEEQVSRTPDQIALVYEDRQMTYEELNRKANRVARHLRTKGIRANSIVGIMVQRSFEMIIGILGILKAGGAYLPIDPEYPAERIKFMLEDSKALILLTQSRFMDKTASVEMIDIAAITLDDGSDTNPEPINQPHDLAYIIYTSGTTGNPKGVMINHKNVVRLMFNNRMYFDFQPNEVWTLFHSFCFDFSVWEMYGALLYGGKLVIFPKITAQDPKAFLALLKREKVTVLNQTPSAFYNLAAEEMNCSGRELNLKYIIFGGEALKPSKLKHWHLKYPGTKLINMYGITETTVHVTYKEITGLEIDLDISNIGRPIPTLTAYIMDQDLKLQPVGVAGELCVGGDGVGQGYLYRPELTAEKFIENPYIPGERLYRSGDLARYLPGGEMEYLGRIDHQVKIHGFRIELSEIETRLLKHEAVREAVAVAKQDNSGANYLCAYLVTTREMTVTELREYLAQQLPDYMIPAYFVRLDKIPLTPNGKIDRKALPEPDGSIHSGAEFVAPTTKLELLISEIWKEVLNLETIGIHDNFFEVGGNSLRLIKVSALLGRKLGKPVAMVKLFQYPTIRLLADYLRQDEVVESIENNSNNSSFSAVRRNLEDGRPEQPGFDVAVIGMAGRFPGAHNISEFWDNLRQGVESITFFTDTELEAAGIEPETVNRPNYVKAKGIIDNIEYFDAGFFGYSPSDARMLDPQIRVFFECVWEALEDAGYPPDKYPGLIGLYAGASPNYYWEMLGLFDSQDFSEGFARTLLIDKRFLTTRISYQLNLKGPSVFLATACSTSLVAIELAYQALRTGACDIALAGGVSIALPHRSGYFYQKEMILSPDGHCRAFDAGAQGTVGGQGAGVVVLKPLKNALEDRDHIYAVVKGVAVNNDGRRKVGYTAPSVNGQTEVIRLAQLMGRVEPESISYIEAHGTGTILGDPIEIEALKNAFNTSKKQFCGIGSVKTNIGHLDDAAGIAGFIKTVLALQHKQIPPSLHFHTPNLRIDFDNSPFMVTTRLTDWVSDSYPLRAGVSSFGIGGTNAHVILEEAPVLEAGSAGRPWQLLLISAKTQTALRRIAANLVQYFQNNRAAELSDVAYTLAVGREHFAYRRMLVGADWMEAAAILSRETEGILAPEDNQEPVLLFPGQGSQYPDMGRELYETEPLFRKEIERCGEILKQILNIDLPAILYPENKADDSIYDPALAQPVIFSFEYALARLLMQWGIKPQSMIGHSIGEYVAACLAGVFSLEDALTLVAWRGQLLRETAEGAMISVALPEAEITPLLNPELAVAAINTPSLCVVSGSKEAVAVFEKTVHQKGISTIRLPVSHAFHSAMIEPILARFLEKVKQVKLSAPQIPYVSNVTGDWITAAEATSPEYWVRHLRSTVRFASGVSKILEAGPKIMIEVGGGQTLTRLVRRHPAYRSPDHLICNSIRRSQETVSDVYHLLTMLGQLWCHGVDIQWAEFYASERRRRVSLPTYPFERQRFWIDGIPMKQLKSLPESGTTLQKKAITEWFYLPSWEIIPPAVFGNQALENSNGLCLIFVGNHRFGINFAARLKAAGVRPVLVRPGREFAKPEPDVYIINPQDESGYEELCRELAATSSFPQKIINLWSITDVNPSGLLSLPEQYLELGFYSLLYLARAVGKANINQSLQILVIANNTCSVTGDEVIIAEKATLLGPCTVIPQEYPYISCKFIDLLLPEPESIQEDKLLDNLVKECYAPDTEPVIAYRGPRRWSRTFKPIRPGWIDNNGAIAVQPSSRLKKRGTYVITGGLGKIGMLLARNFAAMLQANLILIGHSFFPARTDWEQWLINHEPSDLICRKINQIKELEALGATVLVLTSDLSNPEQLEELIRQAEERFGTIHGVIHAAAVLDGKTIREITKSDCEKFFLAKIRGLLTLYQVFQHRELDFGICMSSLAAILGGIGFIAYAAANSFMDAFAHRLSSTGKTCWLSINWDGWRIDTDDPPANLLKIEPDQPLITPEEGIKAFITVLEFEDIYQVAVSTGDLTARINKWVKLESLKQAPESKASKTNLYDRPALENAYIQPKTAMELKLAEIWRELLGFERIGTGDSFFDLGGDSLKAIALTARLHQEIQVEVPIRQIFETPTIRNLAEYLEQAANSLFTAIQPAVQSEYYPMSSAQKRLYSLNRLSRSDLSYNLPGAIIVEGDLDQNRLTEAFVKLIQRHESLRTSFEMVNGEPVQKVWPEADLNINWREAPEEKITEIINGFIRPFDLSQAPLLRVEVIKMETARYLLLYDMHHIISDAVSMGLLIRECMCLYEKETLPELRIQYKDYAVWQNEQQKSSKIKTQEAYWLRRFAGEIPVLNLPTDFPRPAVRSFEGNLVHFETGPELTAGINRLAAATGTTLYMILLAAYNILLSKYSGQEDICVGSPVAGRSHADLEKIIGMFVNTLVMRNYPAGYKSFSGFLQEVKENSLQAFQNQDYQFEELVDKLNLPRNPSRNPLFDTVFEFQTVDIPVKPVQGLKFYTYPLRTGTAKFDITLHGWEEGDKLGFDFEYCTRLYQKATMERMAGDYLKILETIVAVPNLPLNEIKLKGYDFQFSPVIKEEITFNFEL